MKIGPVTLVLHLKSVNEFMLVLLIILDRSAWNSVWISRKCHWAVVSWKSV